MLLRTINRALLVFCLGVCLGGPALADARKDRLQSLEKKLESSLQMIEKLSVRLAELERASGKTPSVDVVAVAPVPQAPPATPAIAALSDRLVKATRRIDRRQTERDLPVHGRADRMASWSSRKGPVERVVEHGDDGRAALDLERLQLGSVFNDTLTVWFGPFHTPVGLGSTAFPQGANLLNSIHRPRALDHEDKGGVIPAHSVGVWGGGSVTLALGKVGYDVFVANGPSLSERVPESKTSTDDLSNRMVGMNLSFQPSAVAGLTVGARSLKSTVKAHDAEQAALVETRLSMVGGYVGYEENDWELIGEYYRFSNAEKGSPGRRTSQAAFLQVGKAFGALTPYLRHEKASFDRADLTVAGPESGRSYTRQSVGLRYALDPKSSLKFEVGNTREGTAKLIDETRQLDGFAARSYRRGSILYSVAF